MADSDDSALAQRLVDHPRWRWCPGMLVEGPDRLHRLAADETEAPPDSLPIVDDPGTIACLQSLFDEAMLEVMGPFVQRGGDHAFVFPSTWVNTGPTRVPGDAERRAKALELAQGLLELWGDAHHVSP